MFASVSETNRLTFAGNASNGLPERLQGLWWADGIDFPDEVRALPRSYATLIETRGLT
jgi:hypothetical protein